MNEMQMSKWKKSKKETKYLEEKRNLVGSKWKPGRET